jgi:hypothetical protein
LGKEFAESVPEYGGGGDAVGVEVAPDCDFFAVFAGGLEPIDGTGHFIAEVAGAVGQVLLGVDEAGELGEVAEAPLPEDLGNIFTLERLAQGLDGLAEGVGGFGVGENPGLLHGGPWVEAGRSA